jgi:hypothetical protein
MFRANSATNEREYSRMADHRDQVRHSCLLVHGQNMRDISLNITLISRFILASRRRAGQPQIFSEVLSQKTNIFRFK